METATYEAFRQFADSWGLVYMFGIFAVVTVMLFWRGAKQRAVEAARIPLMDDEPIKMEDHK